MVIKDHYELEKAILSNFGEKASYLASLSIEAPGSLSNRIANGSYIGSIDLFSSSFSSLGRIVSLFIEAPSSLLSVESFISASPNWTRLQNIALLGVKDWHATQLKQLFNGLPKLSSVALSWDTHTTPYAKKYAKTLCHSLNDTNNAIDDGIQALSLIDCEFTSFDLIDVSNLKTLSLYRSTPVLPSILFTCPTIHTLVLDWVKFDPGALDPASLFPNLENLSWITYNTAAVDMKFVLKLPKLRKLEIKASNVNAPQVGESPPTPCSTLTKWKLCTNEANARWSWALLQLTPSLKTLILDCFYKQASFARAGIFINQLSVLEKLEIWNCDLEGGALLDGLLQRRSMWEKLKKLTFKRCAKLTILDFRIMLKNSPNLICVELISCPQVDAKWITGLSKLHLTRLVLDSCPELGTSILSRIASLKHLQHLDLSNLPNIWTQHLRILEPLAGLRYLGHVQHERVSSKTTFNVLEGLWPRLEAFKVEMSANRQSLATTFGPLVKIEFIENFDVKPD